MFIYLLIFLVAVFIYSQAKTPESQLKSCKYFMLFLAFFVGVSDMLGGYDRYIYGECFDTYSESIRSGADVSHQSLLLLYRKEWAYVALNHVLSDVTVNRYVFIFILTCLVYLSIYQSFRKYTSNPMFAVVIFLGLWFCFTFTYLRQVLGATIAWYAVKYVLERKPIRFFVILLIAYGFHNSAIIFAPIYFLPIRQFAKRHVIIIMIICFLVGASNVAGSALEAFFTISGQEDRIARTHGHVVQLGGVRWVYVLESLTFLWLIFKDYGHLDESDRRSILMHNMSLIFCAILLFFVRSENGGRLSWYYMIGIISMLTDIVTRSKVLWSDISRVLVSLSLILYFRILIVWSTLLYPYKTFFSPGHREGDHIYERCEYDKRYDEDKFYKLW